MSNQPLRVAFIGAGLFARDVHLPAILKMPDRFEPVAVYSRTRESAEQFAAAASGKSLDITTDYDALLERADIDVLDVLVTINLLPEFVEKALKSGKHVISEKPVAPTVERGRALLAHKPQDRVWMVAENWRYVQAFVTAAEQLRDGRFGKPLQCHWATSVAMAQGNKYYGTEWRRAGDFPGGFLLDGGVHNIAALRLLLGEVASVAAFTAQARADLPPTDTLAASLVFDNGALGTFTTTFAAPANADSGLTVVCENGSLRVNREQLEVTLSGQTDRLIFSDNGVYDELAAFAAAVLESEPHRNTPEEALQDVAVLEALLRSNDARVFVSPERVIDA